MNQQNYTSNNSNGTTLVPAKCPNCGGELTVDPTHEAAVCQYCGTPFIVSRAVQNYNIQYNTYQTNIVNDQRRGVVESLLNYASERQDKRRERIEAERRRVEEMQRRAEERQRRNEEDIKMVAKLMLWAFGWILIFPVPFTILMLRNKELSIKIKYGIIVVAWIIYFIIILVKGDDIRNARPVAPTEESSSIVTTVSDDSF